MLRLLLLAPFVAATLVLAGCGDINSPAPDDAPLGFVLPPENEPARAYGAPGVLSGEVPWTEVTNDEAFFGQFELLGELGALAEPTSIPSEEELDALRSFFAAHRAHPSVHLAEQSVAFAILNRVLDVPSGAPTFLEAEPVSTSHEARRAAAFALRLLLQNENPNADLIAAGLRVVGDQWTSAEIAETERIAVAAARSWVESPCLGCIDGVEPLEQEGRSGRRAVVAAAADHLER